MSSQIRLRRAYDPAAASEGQRFLVERLWPRGIKKTQLRIDGWLKDLAPSAQLRRWYGHEPARWEEFQRRYLEELRAHPDASRPLLEAARRGGVTLIFASRDAEHSSALVLKRYLEGALARRRRVAITPKQP